MPSVQHLGIWKSICVQKATYKVDDKPLQELYHGLESCAEETHDENCAMMLAN
jgi:hypothetical protein